MTDDDDGLPNYPVSIEFKTLGFLRYDQFRILDQVTILLSEECMQFLPEFSPPQIFILPGTQGNFVVSTRAEVHVCKKRTSIALNKSYCSGTITCTVLVSCEQSTRGKFQQTSTAGRTVAAKDVLRFLVRSFAVSKLDSPEASGVKDGRDRIEKLDSFCVFCLSELRAHTPTQCLT
jgi:hypothetical protein